MSRLRKYSTLCIGGVALLLVAGCASEMVTVAPLPAVNAKPLAKVEGSAAGMLGVAATAYYFLPFGLNSRVQRAYDNALAQAPGASGLVDVTIQEDWFWLGIGTLRKVSIQGEAVK